MLQTLFFLTLLVFYSSFIKASETFSVSEEDNSRILSLLGKPSNPPISQFSGYITINQNNGRALFYWFLEALSKPSTKLLLLWVNGGHGCSSIGYGAVVELGPLKVNKNGGGLLFNNLSQITAPIGVGFFYTNTSLDLTKLDDEFLRIDTVSGELAAKIPTVQEPRFLPSRRKLYRIKLSTRKLTSKVGILKLIITMTQRSARYAWSHSIISDVRILFNKI
ncbi:Serine carboxypeptidase-like 26, partial [Bienertia sinuspersici]